MATLTLGDALTRAAAYGHAVVSFVDDRGYPSSVAAGFRADPAGGTIRLEAIDPSAAPPAGREVCVTFSHIRPRKGVGYDERRYVNVWGPASPAPDGTLIVSASRASGWDEQDTPFFEYSERGVERGRAYMDKLGARPRLSAWWTFFLATRLPFLTATVVPVALGGVIAARDGAFSWGLFALTMVAACCVHLGLNIANDIFDDSSGADAANLTPTPFSGGSRVMQYGLVSRRAMVTMCVAFYAAGIAIGLWLAATRGVWLLVIGVGGLFLSLAYTAPPLRLVHRGLGEPVTALGFGPVTTLGAYFVLAQRFTLEAFVASLPVALLIAMVLYVNQVPDREGDEASGKRTVVVRFPASVIVRGYALAVVLAYLIVVGGVATRLMPPGCLLALLTFPLARRVHRALRDHYDRPYELMPAMQVNIGLHLATGLLLVAGYLLDVLF